MQKTEESVSNLEEFLRLLMEIVLITLIPGLTFHEFHGILWLPESEEYYLPGYLHSKVKGAQYIYITDTFDNDW